MMYIDEGWLSAAQRRYSPNFGARLNPASIDLVVVHNISLPAGEFGNPFIEDLFCNRLDCASHPSFADLENLRVSSHLLIRRTGAITQFVSFLDRAWHAGVSHFKGRDDCNDFSIGIELEGTDHLPYTDSQYRVLQSVLLALIKEYEINTDAVVGHSDIAPERKTDPGPAFDWVRVRNSITGRH